MNTTIRKRTIAVDILTLIALFAGAIAVFDTLRHVGLLPVGEFWDLDFYDRSWLGALLSGIVALIWFSVARQLWTLDSRGWLFVVLISVLNLIILFVSVLGDTTWQAVAPGLIISGLALILSALPSTRAAFAPLPVDSMPG